MREKYILERHPEWYSMTLGLKDISNADVLGFADAATKEDSAYITKEHNRLVRDFVDLAQAWSHSDPESFRAWWYSK